MDVNSNSILCPVAHLLVLKVIVEVEAGARKHKRVDGDAGVAAAGRSLAHVARIYTNATRNILQNKRKGLTKILIEIIRTFANASRSLGVMMMSGVRSNMKF